MNALKCPTLALLVLAALPTTALARSHRAHDYREYERATVFVENETSVAMTVSVDHGAPQTIRPYRTEAFVATGPYAEIEATYVQFGERRTLSKSLVALNGRRSLEFGLHPTSVGLLKLVNDTGVAADVFADGREIAELRAGETRIVRMALGSARVEMIANGVYVGRLDTNIRAFAEPTLVGRAPTTANVTVVNPFPFDLRVSDERGNTRTIEQRGRTVFVGQSVGTARFVARRTNGDLVDDERVNIRNWTGAIWTPDVPSTGLVRVDSDYGRTARVLVDGRITAMIPAYGEESVRLPVGPASIEVRDLDGVLLEKAKIEVDAWRTITVDFEAPRRSGSTAYADYRDEHSGEHAGGRDDQHGESDDSRDGHGSTEGRDAYGHEHASGESCSGRQSASR